MKLWMNCQCGVILVLTYRMEVLDSHGGNLYLHEVEYFLIHPVKKEDTHVSPPWLDSARKWDQERIGQTRMSTALKDDQLMAGEGYLHNTLDGHDRGLEEGMDIPERAQGVCHDYIEGLDNADMDLIQPERKCLVQKYNTGLELQNDSGFEQLDLEHCSAEVAAARAVKKPLGQVVVLELAFLKNSMISYT